MLSTRSISIRALIEKKSRYGHVVGKNGLAERCTVLLTSMVDVAVSFNEVSNDTLVALLDSKVQCCPSLIIRKVNLDVEFQVSYHSFEGAHLSGLEQTLLIRAIIGGFWFMKIVVIVVCVAVDYPGMVARGDALIVMATGHFSRALFRVGLQVPFAVTGA